MLLMTAPPQSTQTSNGTTEALFQKRIHQLPQHLPKSLNNLLNTNLVSITSHLELNYSQTLPPRTHTSTSVHISSLSLLFSHLLHASQNYKIEETIITSIHALSLEIDHAYNADKT